MLTASQHRRMDMNKLRVEALVRIMRGMSNTEFADRYDLNASYLSQILNGHRPLGERAAANMEKKIGLAPGTLSRPEPPVGELDANVEPGPDIRGQLPLISWVQAGAWSEVIDLYAVGDAEMWLPCPAAHGPRAFALRVKGESMYNPHGRRSFRPDDLIFVDPDRNPENGSLVVAKLDDSQEATFKQLVIEDGKRYLKALNPAWPEPMIPINGNCTIVGVVFSKVELL